MSDTTDPPSLHEVFGALRALMQEEPDAPRWRLRAFKMLRQAWKNHPDEYQDEWVPYLAGFPKHWEEPLTVMLSLEALEMWHQIIPFARFDFQNQEPVRWKSFEASVAFSAVSSLTIEHDKTFDAAKLGRLLHSPRAQALSTLRLKECRKLGNDAASLVVASPVATQLRELSIRLCDMDVEGARILSEAESLSGLTSLRLCHQITAEGRRLIDESVVLPEGVRESR